MSTEPRKGDLSSVLVNIWQRLAFTDAAGDTACNSVSVQCENTHRERLLPAGSHYGGSDDGDVEFVLLLLHHTLSQGFGVGVRVGHVANEPRRDVAHDAVVHPPADTNKESHAENYVT